MLDETVDAIKAAGLRDNVKIMIGGAPVTQEYCDKIGADAYTSNAAEAADRIADGESVSAVHTGGAVAVADLEDSSDPLLKAVYNALKDNGGEKGYVYIEFDPNDYESTGFVQWSASESGGLIGQYPNSVKTVEESEGMTFGQKN